MFQAEIYSFLRSFEAEFKGELCGDISCVFGQGARREHLLLLF